jgi:hypothetical protein
MTKIIRKNTAAAMITPALTFVLQYGMYRQICWLLFESWRPFEKKNFAVLHLIQVPLSLAFRLLVIKHFDISLEAIQVLELTSSA